MSNEELQRVMEFIIKRQESFAEGMEQMRVETRAWQAQAAERVGELERAAVTLFNVTAELTTAHRTLAEKMIDLAETQRQLAESLAHTDQRVNVLIDIIQQGRNGRSQ
jgi:hypothetical protein